MLNVNGAYTEKSIAVFIDDISAHLALQMTGHSFLEGHKTIISSENVSFTAFEDDEMNTVRKTLLLLVVALSEYHDYDLQDKGVVELPEDSIASGIEQNQGGDLFEEFPLTAKTYCLYLAYQALTEKLSQRNTPLFRILYICTCLEFWRQKVPPEVVVGPIGKDVHWGDLILRLTGGFSKNTQKKFRTSGFGRFIQILRREVESVSQSEIPENVLRHFYVVHGTGTHEQVSLVQRYLNSIMAESRKL